MSENYRVGLDITEFQDNGRRRPVSRVTLLVDEENAFTAGDDTGLEITADCPYATQEMADAVLAQVQGYEYQAFTAGAANVDPAAELGDSITVSGVYSVISSFSDHGDGYPDVSAPGEAELEDEYPSAGPMTQEINRKFAETRSSITKTAEEIRLEVQNEVSGLSSSVTVALDAITGRVEDTESGLSQTLRIAADGVTITNAQGSRLTIDGGQIDATKIHTEQLDASKINAAELNLSGAITFGDLDAEMQTSLTAMGTDLTSTKMTAETTSQTVGGWMYTGTTYIDGAKLMTGTVRASTLEGGEIYLLDQNARRAGSFTLDGASSYAGSKVVMRSGAVEITADYGDVFIQSSVGRYIGVTSYVSCGGNLAPTPTNSYSCGMSGQIWTDIYAANSVIQTSDRQKKKNLCYDLDLYDAFFDALRPVSFLFTDGQSGRRHIGMIAQDVESALTDAGLTDMEFAGFVKSPREDEDGEIIPGAYDYALRYGEFVALTVWQIQRLKKEIADLKQRLPY